METPSQWLRRLKLPRPSPVPRGLKRPISAIEGAWARRSAPRQQLLNAGEKAAEAAASLRDRPDAQLAGDWRKASQLLCRTAQMTAPAITELLPLVGELARRHTGLTPYPVQYAAARGLLERRLVEMPTGEGKTLVLALAATIAAALTRPVHVITANDYLAERDAKRLRRFFAAAGWSSSYVVGETDHSVRPEHYGAQIVYTTGRELLGDYLRDQLGLEGLGAVRSLTHPNDSPPTIQRGLHTVLVDEADSVLIDEAVTPLILNQPIPNAELRETMAAANALSETLRPGLDYLTNAKHRSVTLLPPRLDANDPTAPPFLRNPRWRRHFLETALEARTYFRRDEQYLRQDGRIILVDESTGRTMPDRRWRQGLQEAVELREGVPVTPPSQARASMSFQQFFRAIPVLSGITGTAWENRGELWRLYRLPVVVMPPHRPSQRVLQPTRTLPDAEAKIQAIIRDLSIRHASGQPVLIGTASIAGSEVLARALAAAGLPHSILNARQDAEESAIIARAGQAGQITIATNMAGRGTDIHLGPGVEALGGLHVILAEPHSEPRLDRQFLGRAARQGQPGSGQIFRSFEDRIARQHLSNWLWKLGTIKASPNGWLLWAAQNTARRYHYRQRQVVLERDRWFDRYLG